MKYIAPRSRSLLSQPTCPRNSALVASLALLASAVSVSLVAAAQPTPTPAAPGNPSSVSTSSTDRQGSGIADTLWRTLDPVRVRLANLFTSDEPRHIAAYRGYGNGEFVWIRGRLLGNEPTGGPKEDDGWWQNLLATFNRWETAEIPGAEIRLDYAGTVSSVTTDEEGYYRLRIPIHPMEPETRFITAWHEDGDRVLMATHRLSLLDDDASFMVISDMDDTVIHTGITNLLLRAQLTFLNNARTRKPLTGVDGLYQSLTRGRTDRPVNPVFYLSNAAWNMYDLMNDFLDLNRLPEGPLLLRDRGWGADTADHKIETLRELLTQFEHLPAILIGDSGQHDAEIYSRIAEEHPGRVAAIYIRDVDPEDPSEYDDKVDRIIERSRRLGVPFLRVQNSNQIARHAADLSLLPHSEIDEVATRVAEDRQRDTLAEETTAGIGDSE